MRPGMLMTLSRTAEFRAPAAEFRAPTSSPQFGDEEAFGIGFRAVCTDNLSIVATVETISAHRDRERVQTNVGF